MGGASRCNLLKIWGCALNCSGARHHLNAQIVILQLSQVYRILQGFETGYRATLQTYPGV